MTATTSLSKPTIDDAPNECAYAGCDRPPTHTVRFRDPTEYVCYCATHSEAVYAHPTAKYRTLLR